MDSAGHKQIDSSSSLHEENNLLDDSYDDEDEDETVFCYDKNPDSSSEFLESFGQEDEYGNNPYNYINYYNNQECSDEWYGAGTSPNFYCDTCDKSFISNEKLDKHLSEHKTCGIDGCKFTAHEKIIDKHVKMQHASGLFTKIGNLEGPEDIAKWIAERKQKYPSKENVEKRYERQMSMLKRGERLWKKNRFDKNNKTRFTLKNKQLPVTNRNNLKRKHVRTQKPKSTKSLLDDKSDWNDTMFPFRGTKSLLDESSEKDDTEVFDDKEWQEDIKRDQKSNKIAFNNALGALMGAYGSSSDESEFTETNSKPKNTETRIKKLDDSSKMVSDDEGPSEEKIIRKSPEVEEDVTKSNKDVSKDENRSRKRKRSRRKSVLPQKKGVIKKEAAPEGGSSNLNKVTSAVYKKRKVTLLERLLGNEIRHERNVILQSIRYVVENNFFD